MSIYVRGDTHGDWVQFLLIDRKLKAGDVCIICGDVGFFLNEDVGDAFLDELEKKDYSILFVDGNHDNFTKLYSFPEEMWNGGKIHRIRKNVIHLCRGQVFEIEGKTFFTFGGGYSIDKEWKKSYNKWWEEEMPTEEEYEEGKRNLEKHNWKVDYIITHTVNTKSVQRMAQRDGFREIKGNFIEELPLNNYLEEIDEKTEYKKWFFGHFHRDWEFEYIKQVAVYEELLVIE